MIGEPLNILLVEDDLAHAEIALRNLVKPVDFEKFVKSMASFGYSWLAWNEYPHRSGAPHE